MVYLNHSLQLDKVSHYLDYVLWTLCQHLQKVSHSLIRHHAGRLPLFVPVALSLSNNYGYTRRTLMSSISTREKTFGVETFEGKDCHLDPDWNIILGDSAG